MTETTHADVRAVHNVSLLPSCIIPAGQSSSNAVDLGNLFVVGLITPSGWNPAVVTPLVSIDNVTFYPLADGAGHPFFFNNIVPGMMIKVDPALVMMAAYLKLLSGTPQQPVSQIAQRQFSFVGRSTLASP